MAWLQVKNKAESTLNGAINDVVTSMVVTSATPFPTATPFRLTLEDEIVEVTAIAGTTFTITRGVESTTGAAHADGTPVYLNILASHIQTLQAAAPVIVRKTADETVNDSTTLQNDNHLFFAVAANEIWQFELFLLVTTGATPGIKYNFVAPSGATGYFFSIQCIATTEVNDEGTFATPYAGAGAMAGRLHFRAACILINSTTAGNFQLQWAQLAAEASNTIVHANSCIIAHKLA